MDKNKIAKKIVANSSPKRIVSSNPLLPTDTPFYQLNYKNILSKYPDFYDKKLRNDLYNTKIDTRQSFNGKNEQLKNGSTVQADYNPNTDVIKTYTIEGMEPSTIKHELLHKNFSNDSGQINYKNKPVGIFRVNPEISKIIPNKYNPLTYIDKGLNKIVSAINENKKKKSEDYAKSFNEKWDKEKNAPMSSRRIALMKKIDKHLENNYRRDIPNPYDDREGSPYTLPQKNFSKATERNSYINANAGEF